MAHSNLAGIRTRAGQALSAGLFAGVAGLMLPPDTAAAQTPDATTVTAVQVSGAPAQPDSPKYVAPLIDTPQTITVIPAQVIQAQNLLSLRDILSTVPGITFGAGEGGGGYGDSINLRGYAASNSISTDGIRDTSQYTRSDPFDLEQITVSNGASSVYGGSGAVGGGIDLDSKAPLARDFVDVTAGAGTAAYGRLTLDANRSFQNGMAVRLNAMVHQNDAPGRDVESFSRWGIAPSLLLGAGTPTQATFSYFHQHDDNTPQYGVPYASNTFLNGPLPGVSPSLYFGYRNIDAQVSDVDSLTGRFDHEFFAGLSFRNITRWQQVDQLTVVDPPQGTFCLASGVNPQTGSVCSPSDSYLPSGPRGMERDTRNTELVNQSDLTWKFKTGALAHALNLGASFSAEGFHLDSGNVLRNPLGATPNPVLPLMGLTDPNTLWSGPVNFVASGRTDGTLNDQAVYLFDDVALSDRWQVNGGVRWEATSGTSTAATLAAPFPAPPAQPPVTQGALFRNAADLLSWRLGLVFKPAADASLYAAFGNAETPSQTSVRQGCTATTCDVKPEQARNYEVGGKWDAMDGRLLLTGSVFRNERTNYLVASDDPATPDQVLDGASRVDGAALGASGKLTARWAIFFNYTYLTSAVLQGKSDFCVAHPAGTGCPIGATDPTGRELVATPNNAASLWTTYEFPGEIRIGYGATYSGDYLLSNTNASGARAPAYLVQRAMVSCPLGPGLDLQLNINNLFDTGYYTRIRSTGTGFGWATPGDRRNATLTLDKRF